MLATIPGLQERLMDSSEEEIRLIADLVRVNSLEMSVSLFSLTNVKGTEGSLWGEVR